MAGAPIPHPQLADLPSELVAHILSFLDDRSLARVVPSCRCFRDSLAPRLWASKLQQKFPHSSWEACSAPCATLASLTELHETTWQAARAQGTAPADRGGHSCVGLRGGCGPRPQAPRHRP